MKWLALLVGGQKISVFVVKRTHKHLGGLDGVYLTGEGKIYLASDLSPTALEDALFHELDHAVNDISGADALFYTSMPRRAYDKLEERATRARTPIWHRLLKDLGFRFPKGPNE